MILKEQEDSQRDIEVLERLRHDAVNETTRQQITNQIRNIRAGDGGEAEAAYQLKFHYGSNPDWVIINDLRVEHAGLTAQIDHLLINRLLEFWVCESKRFSGGLEINEHGEFTTFVGGHPQSRPSPIEQNSRHIKLLQRMFDAGVVRLPTRLGLAIKPKLKSLVLISRGTIARPSTPLPGLDTVIKNDQICSTITKSLDKVKALDLVRLVGRATLMNVGEQLLALHRPIDRNWAGQFGLSADVSRSRQMPVSQNLLAIEAASSSSGNGRSRSSGATCSNCGSSISPAIIKFCMTNPARFNGLVFCMICQKPAALALAAGASAVSRLVAAKRR